MQFRLGNFDQALADFLSSHIQLTEMPDDPYHIDFSSGFAKGGYEGLVIGAQEMPVSILHTVQGIGRLLWVGIAHPIDSCGEVSQSVHAMIDFLRSKDTVEIAKTIVPELRELLEQWDFLEPKVRGHKAGFIFGKYGLEVVAPLASVKAVRKYQAMRRANALCTLETMASSPQNKIILEKLAAETAQRREQFFKSVKIHPDKQGKHIVGHKNYNPLPGDKFQPSVLKHPDSQKLLRENAGKGTPKAIFDEATGYREVVDFKECIGDFYDIESKQFISTTRGTIHYGKDGGAHIVPASPNIS